MPDLRCCAYELWGKIANAVFDVMTAEEWRTYLHHRENGCELPRIDRN